MADLPITFMADEARAIAAGKKTVERRLPTPMIDRIAPGDRLWLREPFRFEAMADHLAPTAALKLIQRPQIFFEANRANGRLTPTAGKRRSGRELPRALSRIHLAVESVRLRALQDVDAGDLLMMGFSDIDAFRRHWDRMQNAAATFGSVARRWADNPTTVEICFRAHVGNIDRVDLARKQDREGACSSRSCEFRPGSTRAGEQGVTGRTSPPAPIRQQHRRTSS